MRNIKILTGMRFFAAFHVVLYHNFYIFGFSEGQTPALLQKIIGSGESAVSFFFILSGFILTYVYKDKLDTKSQKKTYLWARFAKIFPLYLLGLSLDIPRVVEYFLNSEPVTKAILKISVSALSYITMLQSWFPRVTTVWNPPAWSISCEAFFYCMLPFIIKPCLKIRKFKTIYFLIYLIPILSYYTVTTLFKEVESDPAFLTFWRSFPIIRIFEFTMGILLFSWVNKNSHKVRHSKSFFFWASIICSFLVVIFGDFFPEKVLNGILLAPLFSVLIVCAYSDDIKGDWIFKNSLTQLLGLSSYALYILHQPLLNYLDILDSSKFEKGLIYFSGVIFLSIITCKYFELPAQRFLKKKFT